MYTRIHTCIVLFSLFFMAWPATVKSQVINVYPNTAVRGQTTNFLITGVGSSFSEATGCFVRPPQWGTWYPDQSPTIHSNTTMNSSINIPANAQLGTNYFHAFCWAWNFSTPITIVDPPVNSGLVSGAVSRDTSSSCNNVDSLANQVIQFLPGPYYAFTDANGSYSTWLPLGNYTITVPNIPQGHTLFCPTPSYSINITTPGQTVPFQNFRFVQQAGSDLSAQVIVNPHRPGFSTTNYILLENLGSTDANNIVVKTKVDSIQTYNSASPTAASFANDTITWNVDSLPANSQVLLYFNVRTPLNSLNWNIHYGCTVTSASPDINPNNNSHQINTSVTGSYDPNDKQVWTQDNVNADGPINPNDSLLRYLIRFQNTGTDTAFNIFIRDTLDGNLDLASMEILGASHPYYVTSTNGNEIAFVFANILLPDSNRNEPESHGFIEYRMKRLPNLTLGTEINNTAHIYFDFNSPIVTNTVTSKICPPVTLDFSASVNVATVNLTNQSTGTLGTVQWDFGDGNTSSVLSPSHTYASSGVYNICLTVTDTCGSRQLCQRVTVCPPPVQAGIAYSASSLSLQFADSSVGNPTSWLWTFGDGNSSTHASPSHVYATPGTYTVCLITSNLCSTDTSCQSITVTCLPPVSAFTFSNNNLLVNFVENSQGNIVSWNWQFGDGNSSALQNPSHIYANAGVYNACLITTNDCNMQDTVCQAVGLVSTEPGAGAGIFLDIFPNPSDGLLHLQGGFGKPGSLKLRVMDLAGRTLHNQLLNEVQETFHVPLDLSILPNGTYFLQFDMNGQKVNRKISIMK